MASATGTRNALSVTLGLGNKRMRVAAVVVTHNRRVLLEECLRSIDAQTHAADAVVVVDNASTDDTQDFLMGIGNPRYRIATLAENTGGAGGFAHGIALASELPVDLIWIMDDDCITDPDALERLVEAAVELQDLGFDQSFLCSRVTDLDGVACNHPVPSQAKNQSGWPRWADLAERGYVLVDECTFVSVAIPIEQVRQAGLPFRQMFIWGDDTEYTRRLAKQAPGVFVGASHVLHKRVTRGELSIHKESSAGRLPFYRHHYRNRLYLYRHYFPRGRYLAFMVQIIWDFVLLLARGQIGRAALVGRGFLEGLLFNPSVEPVSGRQAPLRADAGSLAPIHSGATARPS
jgi:GT2 family glycosyltransferase